MRRKKDDVYTEKLIEVYRGSQRRDAAPVVSTEIVPIASTEIVRRPTPEDMNAMLDRLVSKKIEEALAERAADQLEPVHRSRRIRPFHPGFERDKHALYFERYGCDSCGRKEGVSHCCNAKCDRCNNRYTQRMRTLEHEWVSKNPESKIADDIDRLTRRLRSAREV